MDGLRQVVNADLSVIIRQKSLDHPVLGIELKALVYEVTRS